MYVILHTYFGGNQMKNKSRVDFLVRDEMSLDSRASRAHKVQVISHTVLPPFKTHRELVH